MPFSPTVRRVCGAGALLAAASLGGCDGGGATAVDDSAHEPVTVELAQVEARLLRDVATFSGQLSAEHSVVLKAEMPGVIEEVAFAEGQDVEEGQSLFRLRSDEQAARLSEAQAMLALGHEVFDRVHTLATRNAASQAARDEAAAELAVAQARVDLARVRLERTRVRAPFDGVLGMRLVSPGDRVEEDTPLVQIDAVDRLQVSYAITELGILFTRVGSPVEVRVAPYPGEVFRGKVFFVSPTLDPGTRRIVAKAWIDNHDRRLRAGLFATVEMEIDRREAAIVVPEAAVVFDREGSYVWKVDGEGMPTRVPVETGLRRDGGVEITLGLQPRDQIVTAGVHKVQAGKRVVAAAHAPPAAGQARREDPAIVGEGT